MEMFDALYDAKDIEFIGVHDERTGTHMADGFARSGQSGVIFGGQNGPGATNLVTGLAQAKAAFSPVISLAGALATSHHYKDGFKKLIKKHYSAQLPKRHGMCHPQRVSRGNSRRIPCG